MTIWKLIWNDEFDGAELDHTKWNVINHKSEINEELQYYSPDEVYVEDGKLVIRSRQRDMGGCRFTSGEVNTRGKLSIQYGKVEIRAKLPKGQGIWPALWLLPDTCNGFQPCPTWPPEIDIMEMLGHEPSKVYLTYHYGELWPNNKQDMDQYTAAESFSDDYHIFTVYWGPEEIRWYIDGVLHKTYNDKASITDTSMMLIMNTAVGGSWPGSPDETTSFPAYMYIDYVRVYERQ